MNNTFGNWPSPITAQMLTQQSAKISEPQACGEELFWLESRPAEKGRNALVHRYSNGECKDVLCPPHSVRSRAHEYGGACYLVTPEYIFCVLDADQRVHIIDRVTHELRALSPAGNFRYADFCWDKTRRRLIAIREDFTCINHAPHNKELSEDCNEELSERRNEERSELVAIDLAGKVRVLASGADFYSNPRLNSTDDTLSYLCWNHPQMPWDGTECYCASLDSAGDVRDTKLIAGGINESIFQPQWSPADELFFVSDRNNWWNIYKYTFALGGDRIESICDMPAEFATPQWVFGMSTYGFLNREEIFCCFSQNGQWNLGIIQIEQKKLRKIANDFTDISAIHCNNSKAYFLAASATQTSSLYCFNHTQIIPLLPFKNNNLSSDDIALPEPISFATSDGELAHGFYYAPKNKQVRAPVAELPPLILMCHGGPTGATETSLNIKIQFWTSRGFAVLDVNYRGSTGYGRQYRDRLKNNWGVTDVIDVCSGAQYLVDRGLVDRNKIAIRGSSAGGYTVLAALTFSNTFKAGASLYGIGDLEALARDTHKFEAHYLDSLVGEYPAQKITYQARSPINHIEKLNCPVIFFQGLKDKVVPPSQAEAMVAALRQKGIRTEYIAFAEEAHGFRQAETIEQAIHAEFMFYQEVFQIQT